jgi:hypothetical protein
MATEIEGVKWEIQIEPEAAVLLAATIHSLNP